MRILFFSEPLPPENPGGGGKCSLDIIKGLANKNIEIISISNSIDGFIKKEKYKNYSIHRVPVNLWEDYFNDNFKKLDFDIIHDDAGFIGLKKFLYKFYRKKIPIITRLQLIYAKIKSILENKDIDEKTIAFLNHGQESQNEEFSIASKIICGSNEEIDNFKQLYPQHSHKLTIPIMHGTNFYLFNKPDENKTQKDKITIFFNTRPYIGHIIKGADIAFDVFKNLNKIFNNLELFVTCSQFDEYLKNEISNVSNIIYKGWLHGNDYLNLLKSVDICLVPSRYEPGGMVAIEGMALGKIVIASNTGGLKEIIVNNETGFMINNSSDDKIISDYTNIITNTIKGNLLNQFSYSGPKRAEVLYSLESIIDKYISVYKDILGIN